jgi:signal peptidase I
VSRRLGDKARKTANARHLRPEIRHRVSEELRGHLEDAARDYEALGCSRRQAEKLALRDFGDTRRTRTDISRAWRGRRTVLFPEAPGESSASFWIYDARVIFAILALVVLLRWQVVAAYHIPTKSMEPTLHGDERNGDRILVNKLYFRIYRPVRWQVAVFKDDKEDRNLIKRVVGLPGESLSIANGDVYADGVIQRKPRHVEDELLVPVYARNRDVTAEVRGLDSQGLESWTVHGDWAEVHRGFYAVPDEEDDMACLDWAEPIYDDIPGDGAGQRMVGDLVLQFEVSPDRGAEAVGVVLREGKDEFELRVPVGSGDTVVRRNKEVVATAPGVFLNEQETARIRFGNLDDLVRVEIGGTEVLSYEVPDASVTGDEVDFHPPAKVGIQGGSGLFFDLALSRDIHYLGETGPWQIPEDHYFMLGDNSNNSHDSRATGAVHESRLIGRPIWVIWPVSRVKTVR